MTDQPELASPHRKLAHGRPGLEGAASSLSAARQALPATVEAHFARLKLERGGASLFWRIQPSGWRRETSVRCPETRSWIKASPGSARGLATRLSLAFRRFGCVNFSGSSPSGASLYIGRHPPRRGRRHVARGESPWTDAHPTPSKPRGGVGSSAHQGQETAYGTASQGLTTLA